MNSSGNDDPRMKFRQKPSKVLFILFQLFDEFL